MAGGSQENGGAIFAPGGSDAELNQCRFHSI
jgi:hypothetical protein